MTFENLVPAQIGPSRDDVSDDSIEGNSNISSDDELSALELGDLSLLRPMLKWKIRLIRCVGQLSECRRPLIDRLETSVLNRQFNVFRGHECEDVHVFITNYERAGRLIDCKDRGVFYKLVCIIYICLFFF